MQTLQLILQIILIIGVFYVIFVQDRNQKSQNQLLGTLKDYPNIAKQMIKWKEENIKEEARRSIELLKAELTKKDFTAKLCAEILLDVLNLTVIHYPYYYRSAYLDNYLKIIPDLKSKELLNGFFTSLKESYEKFLEGPIK